MPVNDGKALYYPYIYIQNENWLKASLFYWDEISRIVPAGFLTKDSDNVKRVIEAGILFSDYPQEHHKEIAKSLFSEKLIPIAKRYESAGKPLKEFLSQELRGNYVPAQLIDLRKIEHHLAQELVDFGLADHSQEHEGFLNVDQNLGGCYMTCLASAMSEQRLDVYSDSPGYTVLGEYLANGNLDSATSLDPVSYLLSLDIGFPSLSILKHIDIFDIIQFHRNHADKRREFRVAIENFRSKLIGLTNLSERDLKYALAEERERIQSSIKVYQFTASEVLNIPVYAFVKNSLKILLLAGIEVAFNGISEPNFISMLGYIFGAEAINFSADKVPFLPNGPHTDVARYLLPVNKQFKRYYPTY